MAEPGTLRQVAHASLQSRGPDEEAQLESKEVSLSSGVGDAAGFMRLRPHTVLFSRYNGSRIYGPRWDQLKLTIYPK